MWDTNRVKAERKITCDDDCKQSGCPGHTLELVVHSVAGRGSFVKDGVTLLNVDRTHAEALLSMLEEIKLDGATSPKGRIVAIVCNNIPPAKLEELLGKDYEEFKRLSK